MEQKETNTFKTDLEELIERIEAIKVITQPLLEKSRKEKNTVKIDFFSLQLNDITALQIILHTFQKAPPTLYTSWPKTCSDILQDKKEKNVLTKMNNIKKIIKDIPTKEKTLAAYEKLRNLMANSLLNSYPPTKTSTSAPQNPSSKNHSPTLRKK